MSEQFFEKKLAARKIEAIPGMLEFDIPVHPIMYRLTQKAYEILKSKHM